MKAKTFLFCVSASLVGSIVLSGCVPLMIGGAVGTTAFVTTDRRTVGAQMADNVMEQRISYEITQAIKSGLHLTVTSYNQRVLLTGEVSTETDKQLAQKIAQRSLEVKSVVNELKVGPENSITQRLSDSTLANKVRSYLVGTKDVSLNQMKVTVNNSTVYLMGLVTAQEAQLAANVASRISGVHAVVKVFEVISEQEVERRMRLINQQQNEKAKESALTTNNLNTTSSSEVRLQ